jgi:hypothetical protein
MSNITGPQALSRHTGANTRRCDLVAQNLNAWCRVPGSPFADGLLLLRNHPDAGHVSVRFGPIELPPGVDAIVCLFTSPPRPEHANRLGLAVQVSDGSSIPLAHSRISLGHGERGAVAPSFDPPRDGRVHLRLDLTFDHFAGGPAYGSVNMRYALAYEGNPLVDLFNDAGSDKGTQIYWGEGVPHCYALSYHTLLAPMRDESFNLLEIGLDTASQGSAQPADAPSLRAWRRYLPNAMLYGYDIHDFGFFEQEATHTFRGDQASREDLRRFLAEHGAPAFRMVIDDGSHAPSHQQISLAALFPHVEPSGLYVIEDLHWQPHEESPTTLESCGRWPSTGGSSHRSSQTLRPGGSRPTSRGSTSTSPTTVSWR